MISNVHLLVALLVVIAAIAVLAARLKLPSSILLVAAGAALALVPGLPAVRMSPDFMLLVVLPPIIYSSAVAMSWREFYFSLRPITLLAFGCVVFTTLAVAAATHYLIGLSWQVAFVLGAIVSPPDAVAPMAIARRMQLPRRLVVVLEGEGLANDATALILYRFAVAAVGGALFSLERAVEMFTVIVIGEILWGMAIGWVMLRLRRWVKDPSIEMTLSVLTPFLAYWPPEQLGGSGVLATVTAGLYISWNGLRLISAATRLQGIFFWGFLMYLIEGMVFLVTGLQARTLLAGIHSYTAAQLELSAVVVGAVVIATRFVWMYPATYLPRWLVPAIARRDPAPPWQYPTFLAYTGVRGVVSLAAALALPLVTDSGEPFPHRDLILFLTFIVVVITLVGQGLTLPLVIRVLGLENAGAVERANERSEENLVRREAITTTLKALDRLTRDGQVPEEATNRARARHRDRLAQVELRDGDADSAAQQISLERVLIAAERTLVNDEYRSGALRDHARRRIEHELDLREAQLDERDDE
jgi:CPA1 family monovalent cation:H+ antiporter